MKETFEIMDKGEVLMWAEDESLDFSLATKIGEMVEGLPCRLELEEGLHHENGDKMAVLTVKILLREE